jgi:hypothetical protein
MRPRMKDPAAVIPDAMTAIRALNGATIQGGVSQQTPGERATEPQPQPTED